MEYRKPEIAVMGQATEVIQGEKSPVGETDSNPHDTQPTIAAYEADE